MNEPEYERIYSFESTYWWHVSRRHLVKRLIDCFAGDLSPKMRYLDLGCGTGIMLGELGPRFERVTGMDYSRTALGFAQTRSEYPMIQADARHLPYPDNHFDLVTCLDIIEHIREDNQCIAEMYRILKPGGHLVLSVPALDFLWSEHDEAVFHLRRYASPSLKAKVRNAGFEVVRSTYAVMLLTPPIFFIRMIKALTRTSVEAQGHDFPTPPAPVNRFLTALHNMETAISLRVGLPFGSGLVCLSRKPAR